MRDGLADDEIHGRIRARDDLSLNWLHISVPIDRNDDDYYAPLHKLRLPDRAELYLGLLDAVVGVAGTRRRVSVAEHFASCP